MPTSKPPPSDEAVEPLIFSIRGHRVMLDSDRARLYGVTTNRFNEAFKRNRQRFPEDFAFQITTAEFASLRSQFATSSSQPTEFLAQAESRSQFVTSKSHLADSKQEDLNWSQFATSSRRALHAARFSFLPSTGFRYRPV